MSNEEYEQDAQSETEGEGAASEESFDSEEMGDGSFVSEEAKKPMSKSTLVMVVIIALAIGGMYFMHQRASATAAEPADTKATQVIKQFMSEKEKNSAQMRKMIDETKAVVDQFLNYPNLKQIPLAELQSNPFRMMAPKDDAAETEAARLKKLKEDQARLSAEKAQIEKAAQSLNLQSIVTSGARKACMINNTLVMEGQSVQEGDKQFTVVKITSKQVTVKCGEHEFPLSMRK
jgi:hypothetical protein